MSLYGQASCFQLREICGKTFSGATNEYITLTSESAPLMRKKKKISKI